MMETVKTQYGSVSVRTTSLNQISLAMKVEGVTTTMVLHLDAQGAEALQGALARARGMLPCPRYAEALEAVAG